MPDHGDFSVMFAEEDNMFRLMEMAILRHATPQGVPVIEYFFGPAADRATTELLGMADDVGLSRTVRPIIHDAALPLGDSLDNVDMLVVEAERVTGADLERAGDQLRVVQKFGQVLDNIDTARARELGIPIATMARRTTISCAEHVIALMLGLSRRLIDAHAAVVGDLDGRPLMSTGQVATKFNWGNIEGVRLLHGRTLGLIGFGEIARQVATRALAMGMDVQYDKRTPVAPDSLAPALRAARHVSLDDVLRESDVVSIHLPSTAETARLIDEAALSKMRPSTLLINMARGAIVDEDALEASLRAGAIAGAALDVHREEPIPADSGLLTLDNVLYTPHMAAGSAVWVFEEVRQMLANIARIQRQERTFEQVETTGGHDR